ncbi:hypothetical protein AKJ47_02530 [candidate division MSBL1 archaeon SCGC-AAA261G05]|uniref:Uncharacterized protein n=1 Tax=candidate division MSBL1 archaeon SCGC-AAA261G05 TaxID=1698276 RepID=A0A133V9Z3_9EURY|nr:hypothetical protein AKJ47_02530 [candidate division MSBL1 archaeon SCGC-AAA261G05]
MNAGKTRLDAGISLDRLPQLESPLGTLSSSKKAGQSPLAIVAERPDVARQEDFLFLGGYSTPVNPATSKRRLEEIRT